MTLRAEQRALTRTKVLDAVLDLVADGSLDELSIPAVARRSGVSVATIYRHFPTKDALLAAAAREPARRAAVEGAVGEGVGRDGDDALAAYTRAMWSELSRNIPLLRHQMASASGREMRRARLEQARQLLGGYLDREGVDPSSPEGARLMSVLILLSGSLSLLELHDRQEMPLEEAIDTALWATRTLIDATAGRAA